MPSSTSPIDVLLDRAGPLCSPPGVALEVIRLTAEDTVDAAAIKSAIEADPALSAKLLRVVNSSFFGLSGEVSNLTQALALLGVRPLKMLVLGFSLPKGLLEGLTAEQLKAFWTKALTRAIAARRIATDWFGGVVSGDDAFTAGLLRDLGVLVLIREVGDPYVKFLEATGVLKTEDNTPPPDRCDLEQKTLGFDHLQLTAAMLERWSLPRELVGSATTAPAPPAEVSPLAEVVIEAELIAKLLTGPHYDALLDLLARGPQACGLSDQQVSALVEVLGEQARSLADAMQAPFDDELDFNQILATAQARLAMLAASTASDQTDDEIAEALIAESHDLRLAMRGFLKDGKAVRPPQPKRHERTEAGHAPANAGQRVELTAAMRERVAKAVDNLAARCRVDRVELSVAIVHGDGLAIVASDPATTRRLDAAISDARICLTAGRAAVLTLSADLFAVLMPGVDRRDALAFCHRLASALRANDDAPPVEIRAGVAVVAQVPNRFESTGMVEGALRCLQTAGATPGTCVKSIEVF
ncbi:MAG: HDOD domain-containing protein [Planctomycetota bacterium]